MSVQDEPVPPVPEHTPPKKEDEGTPNAGKYFSHTWTRWFVSLREKVNVINDTVASLSQLVGNGFVTVDGGTAVSRSIVGTDDRVSVANGNGVAGNPTIDVVTADLIAGPNVSFTGSGAGRIIDNGDGPLTISATGGGGGTDYLPWLAIGPFMPSGVTADMEGYRVVRSSGSSGVRPVYHLIGKSSGKYAIRLLCDTVSGNGPGCGILSGTIGSFIGNTLNGIGLWINSSGSNEATYKNNVAVNRGDLAPFTTPTEVMFEIDIDAGNLWIGVAGTWIGGGDPATGTSPTYSITPSILYSPVADMFYPGSVQLLLPSEFITPASAGFTPGWPS